MFPVTTNRILAEKALQKTCAQQCVDWAINLLEPGHDGYYVAMLAGQVPPFNHFELADLRDRALHELGIKEVVPSIAVHRYAVECLRAALAGDVDRVEALAIVKDLCVAIDYPKDLNEFYLLCFAYEDLLEREVQWYWPGATRENVLSIVRDTAEAFVQDAQRDA